MRRCARTAASANNACRLSSIARSPASTPTGAGATSTLSTWHSTMRSDFIRDHGLDAMRIAGERVGADCERRIDVFNPFTNEKLGSVPKATVEQVKDAFAKAAAFRATLTRFERADILNKAA